MGADGKKGKERREMEGELERGERANLQTNKRSIALRNCSYVEIGPCVVISKEVKCSEAKITDV